MRRILLPALGLLLLLWALPAQAAGAPQFTVTQSPPAALRVGDPFTLQVHVPQQAGRWLLTVELVDPATHDRADFGGWLVRRPRLADPTAGATDLTWEGHAGASGRFRMFVHATPADDSTTEGWSSPGFDLTVQPAPPQNSTPMLSVVIGEPLLVGLWGLWTVLRRRRLRRI